MNAMQPPTLEHSFSHRTMLGAPEIIGRVPEGIRFAVG
jgi:hypothetical protein